MTARPIMVQGTMSGAGKSLLVAGLCRVLARDGLRVAPFKSQNMALNSFITETGEEMGRAQVVQAEAAGIAPEVAMNPILLKPTDDVGSQVIVGGQVLGNMTAREYFAFKRQLIPQIRAAYDDLARRFDVIVIEGAGSPVEMNLKDDDIVNMGVAKMFSSPVLLVGDIDRGGVFAQLVGTMMLLDPDERAHVKALVVNKFRGDAAILEPGLDILRDRCGVPVAGVIPYLSLDIDDEDSLSERFLTHDAAALVDVVVVRLPRVSNSTDLIALSAHDGVNVRYVSSARELGWPDMIVLPGTKSTLSDLRWLRESGLEAALLKRAASGVVVFGICGGFQMLGRSVSDPQGVEGGGEMRGMGLLPLRTVFSEEKRQERVVRTIGDVGGPLRGLSGIQVEGYEIHMGATVLSGADASVDAPADALADAPLSWSGNVYGTYIHGFFDRKECSRAVVSSLLEAKGADASALVGLDRETHKERQYDKLADAVRANLDMDLVYRVLEEGA